MTTFEDVREDPYRHDFFAVMRMLERNDQAKPRLGDSTSISEDIAIVSQQPYSAFPASNVVGAELTNTGIPRVTVQFLGMFGPQGPLPLHTTELALIWSRRDPSFSRFVDIVSTRFLQLFYRAWADPRPIAQMERPHADRFQTYLASFAGVGSPVLQGKHETNGTRRDDKLRQQLARLGFSGLVNGRVKSASRLAQLLTGILGIDVEIHEWVGMWLSLEAADQSQIGRSSAALGSDCILGQRSYTINEKFKIRIRCKDLAQYQDYLPGSPAARELVDLVFYYLGYRQDFELELGIRKEQAPALCLGVSGKLGLTGWMDSNARSKGKNYLYDAHFDPTRKR